ncbi:MAG: hypothetical protein IJ165_00005 [Proteobacteria bacterium]|nr:hypothetical protein [Pseudomonadota bacterium]
MRSHHRILSAILFIAVLLAAHSAFSAPVLLTVADTESGQTETWWPHKNTTDSPWFDLFARQNLDLIRPTAAPRLSPAVYAPAALTNANARTLASLFGAQNVLNGQTTWSCQSDQSRHSCTGTFSGYFLQNPRSETPLATTATASAETAELAKLLARNQIAVELSSAILSLAQTSEKDELPDLISKPVIVFSSLPDADTLVQLRKALKSIIGVEDVAERWIADNALAIELNPAQPALSDADFSRIVQDFASLSVPNLIIRHTRSTPQGALFEIVKY